MTELYYAEDDPNISGMVKAYLQRKDIKVSVYGTLADLKQALAQRLPAMVLLDWNMPDGRGDRLCRWIRGTWKELPIIFLTVRGDSADIVSGFGSGADDYETFRAGGIIFQSAGAPQKKRKCERAVSVLRRDYDGSKPYAGYLRIGGSEFECGGVSGAFVPDEK